MTRNSSNPNTACMWGAASRDSEASSVLIGRVTPFLGALRAIDQGAPPPLGPDSLIRGGPRRALRPFGRPTSMHRQAAHGEPHRARLPAAPPTSADRCVPDRRSAHRIMYSGDVLASRALGPPLAALVREACHDPDDADVNATDVLQKLGRFERYSARRTIGRGVDLALAWRRVTTSKPACSNIERVPPAASAEVMRRACVSTG